MKNRAVESLEPDQDNQLSVIEITTALDFNVSIAHIPLRICAAEINLQLNRQADDADQSRILNLSSFLQHCSDSVHKPQINQHIG